MKSHTHSLWFSTKAQQEIIDITEEVVQQLEQSVIAEGMALVSAMHISAHGSGYSMVSGTANAASG